MKNFIDITENQKDNYNKLVNHPLQSYEWGEFRKKTDVLVIRKGLLENKKLADAFTLTIHKIPNTPWNIGYLPKGNLPDEKLLDELTMLGKQNNCIFIQLEPNVIQNTKYKILNTNLVPSAHPLFTKYTFILDLTKTEQELLAAMHSKTRYNIKVAQKHGVEVVEDNSDKAFEEYIRLTRETTKRQQFYAHTEEYHRFQWQTLPHKVSKNQLSSHLLIARYKLPQLSILVTWILFVFRDTLYYPYGASSNEYRNTMASNLMMWEGILFGKKLGLKKFDMWGALGKDPDSKDPWFGFHKFKEGYGAEHVEFIGSFDLIINPLAYQVYKIADKLRWLFLKPRS